MEESIRLLSETPCPGGFSHLRLAAPQLAAVLRPGQSILWGGQLLPMMRCDARQGWLELLLQGEAPGAMQISGPHGEALPLASDSQRWLLMGTVERLASLIAAADYLRQQPARQVLLLLQADAELPFRPVPCRTLLPGMPAGVIATLPLLNDWGVAVRIASHQGLPGCFDGDIAELAGLWLATQTEHVEVVRC